MGRTCIRVAWDNSLAGRNRTGTGVYASELVEKLAARTDIQLHVFTGYNVGRQGEGLFALAVRGLAGLCWSNLSFPHLLKKGRFDLLHSPAFVLPLRCPCPTVVTIHDLTFRFFPEHFDRRWQVYLNGIMPSVLRSTSAVICPSEYTRIDLLRGYDVAPNKVHVVHNGVEHERFHPGARLGNDWARQLGIRAGYLLHVGALSERKNIPTLLRAVGRLRAESFWGDRQLVLAGAEVPRMQGAARIHELIRALELDGNVILAGHVPNEEVPGLYANASMLVMPSFYEGFGLPILESMASGTPVIASNTSSLPEVAGQAAILFPPNDHILLASAIADLLKNRTLAEELRRKGLVRASQFSWERTAEETVSVYRRIANS